MSVAAAVQAEVEALSRRAPEVSGSSLAAIAISLADELDNAGNSATSKSMCARALLETLTALRATVPAEETSDQLDELARRRDERLRRAAH